MKRAALVATASITVACGPHGRDPLGNTATKPRDAELPAAPTAKLGTSGFAGVDWGAKLAAIKNAFPSGHSPDPGHLWVSRDHGGQPAVTTFEFDEDELFRISIAFHGNFASMADCARRFVEVRKQLEPTLGKPSVENLAAYWTAASYEALLACDTNDDGTQAALSMVYTKPTKQ